MLSRTQISDIAFILKANITLFDSDYDAIKVLVDALIKARLEAKENDVRLLSGQIDETKNSKLQLLAEAMRHVVLKEKPNPLAFDLKPPENPHQRKRKDTA